MKWLDKFKDSLSMIRIVRLILGILVLIEAIRSQTWWLLSVSALLFYYVFVNRQCTSCDTDNNCSVKPPADQGKTGSDHII